MEEMLDDAGAGAEKAQGVVTYQVLNTDVSSFAVKIATTSGNLNWGAPMAELLYSVWLVVLSQASSTTTSSTSTSSTASTPTSSRSDLLLVGVSH